MSPKQHTIPQRLLFVIVILFSLLLTYLVGAHTAGSRDESAQKALPAHEHKMDTTSRTSPALVSRFDGTVDAVSATSLTVSILGGSVQMINVSQGTPMVRENVDGDNVTRTASQTTLPGPNEISIAFTSIVKGEKVTVFARKNDQGIWTALRIVVGEK